mmetsp:Transcript_9644/g.33882  ORF Transcript_9644/g.33882 Transcript_9644/m.33882 type:complete len:247 (+) Transcript_9644:2014-2754(+)
MAVCYRRAERRARLARRRVQHQAAVVRLDGEDSASDRERVDGGGVGYDDQMRLGDIKRSRVHHDVHVHRRAREAAPQGVDSRGGVRLEVGRVDGDAPRAELEAQSPGERLGFKLARTHDDDAEAALRERAGYAHTQRAAAPGDERVLVLGVAERRGERLEPRLVRRQPARAPEHRHRERADREALRLARQHGERHARRARHREVPPQVRGADGDGGRDDRGLRLHRAGRPEQRRPLIDGARGGDHG